MLWEGKKVGRICGKTLNNFRLYHGMPIRTFLRVMECAGKSLKQQNRLCGIVDAMYSPWGMLLCGLNCKVGESESQFVHFHYHNGTRLYWAGIRSDIPSDSMLYEEESQAFLTLHKQQQAESCHHIFSLEPDYGSVQANFPQLGTTRAAAARQFLWQKVQWTVYFNSIVQAR